MHPIAKTNHRLEHPMFSLIDELFERPAAFGVCTPRQNGNGATTLAAPLALDLSEQGQNFIVRASLPGFAKDAVKISVEDNILTIEAEHREEREETSDNGNGSNDTKERVIHRERRFASVSRRVELPTAVNASTTTAELKDGVLTIRLPKVIESRAKAISIQ